MALEVQVFGEINRYQPKVIFGLSWRQAGVALVALPVIGSLYAACYVAGLEDLGVVLVVLGAIPAIAVGWVRPMGIKFEQYVGYWWAHQQTHSPFVYAEMKVDHADTDEKGARRESKARTRRFEATN
ncbi:PrgI family protein [Trueperella pyogenes]|uniref:PrgI family protein n=1 Tax=Trueperella pyogenes TaxID=1661 RepID=UPI00345DA021